MSKITWNDVLDMNFVGGDIESQENDSVFRGPISTMEEKDGMIIFSTKWMARISFSTGGTWERCDKKTIEMNKDIVQPYNIGEGRVSFSVQLLGIFVLFPKGRNLDPCRVSGLTAEEIA